MAETFSITSQNRVRRAAKRASYDREAVFRILDAGLVAHVGIVEGGRPFVLPMFYARLGEEVLLHCSSKSRILDSLIGGQDVCITVTLLDGLVLARSAFHHSMNYRSVVAFGSGRLIESSEEKAKAAEAITEKVMKGRWEDTRHPSELEYRATALVALKVESASAKVRSGGPIDDEEDMGGPHWAGVVPIVSRPEEPEADTALDSSIDLPAYVDEHIARSRGSR